MGKLRRRLVLSILLVEIVIIAGAWFAGRRWAEVRTLSSERVARVEPTPTPPLTPEEISYYEYAVFFLAFSPDGRTLMIADGDENDIGFEIYDTGTGEIVRRWRDSGPQIFLSRDGKRLLESSGEGPYRHTLREVSSGRVLRRWTDRQRVLDASPDTGRIVTTAGKGVALLQETATGRVLGRFGYKARTQGGARFSFDGLLLMVDDENGRRFIRVADLRTLLNVSDDGYRFMAAGGKFVSAVDEDGVLRSWPLRGLKEEPWVRTDVSEVSGLNVLADGTLVLTGVETSAVYEMPVETATHSEDLVIQVRSPDGLKLLSEISGKIVGRSANGEYIAMVANDRGGLGQTAYGIMRIRTGTLIQCVRPPAGTDPYDVACAGAVVSNEGRQVVIVTPDREIRFYKVDPQAGPSGDARLVRRITSASIGVDP